METIRLKDLAVGYRMRGKQAKAVLTDVNATVESGRLTCMLGANGVGKSTLLRTLAGFQTALSGEIRIARQREDDREARAFDEIGRLTKKELARRISVVLTGKPDVQNITATELVGLGRSPYTGFWGSLNEADHRIVDEALQLVGIQALADRMIQTLSDGERQKVMIAKALTQETPVIFLDEPTAFLDFPSKVEMMQLLRRLSKETDKTIFFSTHDLELALQIVDTVWMMDKHKGLTTGTPRELAAAGVLSAYIERKGILFDRTTLGIRVLRQ